MTDTCIYVEIEWCDTRTAYQILDTALRAAETHLRRDTVHIVAGGDGTCNGVEETSVYFTAELHAGVDFRDACAVIRNGGLRVKEAAVIDAALADADGPAIWNHLHEQFLAEFPDARDELVAS